MWPPGHLALGYIAYALVRRVHNGRPPDSAATVVLALATQFPDVVDKPLSWSLGVLPTGRSLTHSVVTATILTSIVYRYARRIDRPALAGAFAIGYASHLLGDLYGAIAAGDAESNWFWLWPLVPQEGYVVRPNLGAYVAAVGLEGIALLAHLGVFAVVAGAMSRRGKTPDWPFTAFVVFGRHDERDTRVLSLDRSAISRSRTRPRSGSSGSLGQEWGAGAPSPP